MILDELLAQVDKGINGNPDFIPIGAHPVTGQFGKLSEYINFGKRMYVLFGGMPGSGKTSIVDYMFVMSLYKQYQRGEVAKPFWIYRSMERSSVWKMAKWTCLLAFLDHGVLLDVATLLGMPGRLRPLTKEDRKLIESYQEFWDDFNRHIVLRDGAVPVERTAEDIATIMAKKGVVIDTLDEHLVVNGKPYGHWGDYDRTQRNGLEVGYADLNLGKLGQHRIYEGEKTFIPVDPTELVIHLTDHIGKYAKGDRSDNSVIDQHADAVADARDLYGMAIVDISQFNREIHSTYRQVKTELTINEADFRGCSKPYHNADIAIGMLDPHSLGQGMHAGHIMDQFISPRGHCRYRDLRVVKNNWGPSGVSKSLVFFGENGYIHELPSDPSDITERDLENLKEGINLF